MLKLCRKAVKFYGHISSAWVLNGIWKWCLQSETCLCQTIRKTSQVLLEWLTFSADSFQNYRNSQLLLRIALCAKTWILEDEQKSAFHLMEQLPENALYRRPWPKLIVTQNQSSLKAFSHKRSSDWWLLHNFDRFWTWIYANRKGSCTILEEFPWVYVCFHTSGQKPLIVIVGKPLR